MASERWTRTQRESPSAVHVSLVPAPPACGHPSGRPPSENAKRPRAGQARHAAGGLPGHQPEPRLESRRRPMEPLAGVGPLAGGAGGRRLHDLPALRDGQPSRRGQSAQQDRARPHLAGCGAGPTAPGSRRREETMSRDDSRAHTLTTRPWREPGQVMGKRVSVSRVCTYLWVHSLTHFSLDSPPCGNKKKRRRELQLERSSEGET